VHDDARGEGKLLPLKRRAGGWAASVGAVPPARTIRVAPPPFIVLEGGLEDRRPRPGRPVPPELLPEFWPGGPGAA
jgi:hypothetical protein